MTNLFAVTLQMLPNQRCGPGPIALPEQLEQRLMIVDPVLSIGVMLSHYLHDHCDRFCANLVGLGGVIAA